jgi:cysteine synthase A
VVTPEARAFVDEVLADATRPVVMFALEWCEFCWSARRMFACFGIPYRSIDLDSVAYQEDDRGGKIRAALAARTSISTIPQIFVGGQFIGGSTETFDAWRSGRVQELLRQSGVPYDAQAQEDPYQFLPTWLHPR